ncbi:MAG: WYL domain-containing protein [Allosphingosinicella sp.]
MEKSDPEDPGLRWSIAQRLEFIEARLVWEGRINRSDIRQRFGVTVQQATADLQLYEKIVPANVQYDRNAKTFVPGPHFQPYFLKPLANRQLLQLAAIANGLVDARETWFSDLPPVEVVPNLPRTVPTLTVRWILEAIRTRSAIEVGYQSVKRPDVIRRSFAPHALGYDGKRWHARSWCLKNRRFRDFVLSRITDTGPLTPSPVDPALDLEWATKVDLVLVPNPGLSDGARRSLAKEYNMVRGRLRLPTRVAMAFYTRQHLNLDLALEPARQQLVLSNPEEVDAACTQAQLAGLAALRNAGHIAE